jgi:hypothetical protein
MYTKYTGFLAALFCCGYSLTAHSQEAYKPGYVVQPAGDTLRGFIQARGALRSSLVCRFKTAANAQAVDYAPSALRAYELANGPHYDSRLVPGADSMAPKEAFFLELMEGGKASFYRRRDTNDEVFYYLYMAQAANNEVIRLENRVTRNGLHASAAKITTPVFRTTLSKAFRDCFAVQPELSTLQFSEASLTKIVRLYNSYMETPGTVKPVVKLRQPRYGMGVVGGLSSSKMTFEGKTTLVPGNFSGSTVVAGLYGTAIFPAFNEHFMFRVDGLYERLSYRDSYIAPPGTSTVEVREQAALTFNCLRLPFQARYVFLTGRLRPFLTAGGSTSFLLSNTSNVRSEYTSGSSLVVRNTEINKDIIRSFEVGLLGGAGLMTSGFKGHAISLEIRAERSSGFVTSPVVGAPIFRYSGLVSFDLF